MNKHYCIKYDEWASMVAFHPAGSPFQHPDLFRIYAKYSRIPPELFIHYDTEDQLDGVLLAIPVTYFPFTQLIPHAYVCVNGPLMDPYLKEVTRCEVAKSLLESFQSLKHPIRCPYLELRDMNHQTGKTVGKNTEKKQATFLNLVKDISSHTALWSGLSKTRKRYIKQVMRKGYTTREPNTKEELQAFIKMLRLHYFRIKKPFPGKKVLEGIWQERNNQKTIRIVITLANNEICGGAVLGFCGDTCYEWYIVSDRRVRHSGTAVTFGSMEYAMERGFRTFNFMGAGRKGKAYGVREFKRSFGGREEEYRRWKG